jgi:hypothetical protein
MRLLSTYRENDRTADVYAHQDEYLVVNNLGGQSLYNTEQAAENAAEDWVLSVVDSGKIVAYPRRG